MPLHTDASWRNSCRAPAALSLEQKVRLLTGADFWALHAEPADRPAPDRDVRRPRRRARRAVGRARPVGQRPLADRAGRHLGRGAGRAARPAAGVRGRRKGVDVLLAPTVNLHRTPLGGRHFECFSEDPLPDRARSAPPTCAGCRPRASPRRSSTSSPTTPRPSASRSTRVVDERALRELYLLPFELILAAQPWAVMAAYNARQRADDDRVAAAARRLEGRVGLGRARDVRLGRRPLDRGRAATPRWTSRCRARPARGATRWWPRSATGA